EQPSAEPAPAEKPALETAKEGLDKLRDAANQALKDAQPAIDKAIETAGQALKDAQPTIDKLGASINEIVRNAQDDFRTATEALEKRLNEFNSDRPVVAGDPAATLSAPDALRTDTRAAAKAAAAGIGPAYVGVWVGQASDCRKVDQEPLEMIAVITPTTIRRHESVCNMAETPLVDGKASVAAQCVVEGEVETQTLTVSLPSPDRLTLGRAEGNRVDLVRCHLPG
ncbi:MAG: hypothetical protein Q8Q62_10555, partial [Mesorhizobium sp.]|nr:hypothetical protein [Mesorhizobium sp.]